MLGIAYSASIGGIGTLIDIPPNLFMASYIKNNLGIEISFVKWMSVGLPVATPPNAIVFGAGYVTIPQMCRAGLWLNIIGILLITGLTYAIAIPVLL
jgi:di/tricarboxylate transporter